MRSRSTLLLATFLLTAGVVASTPANAMTVRSDAHPRSPLVASATSDFNGDGFEDLAVGVPFEDVTRPAVVADAGAVNVLYGSSNGIQATGNGGPNDQFWTQGKSGVKDFPDEGDAFGTALAWGDFNGDRYDDLAVGVPSEDAHFGSGAVNVLYGSAAGLQATGNGGPDDQFWRADDPDLNDPDDSFLFGGALAAGDFNKDGLDDLAIGRPTLFVGFIGAVDVLHGSSTGLTATSPDDQWWSGANPDLVEKGLEGDGFGFSLAAADYNGDGFDDLAVGDPYDQVDQGGFGGRALVLYGSDAGLQATGLGAPDDQSWHQGQGGMEDSEEVYDYFGYAVAAGNFNGDGYADLAIGVPNETVCCDLYEGAADVLYGSPTGLQATGVGAPDDQFWAQDDPDVEDVSEKEDFFGFAVASGDFDGDGHSDLAVGAPGELTAVYRSGMINVLYGSDSGLQATGTGGPNDQIWWQGGKGVKDKAEEFDQFGLTLSAGDYNGDLRSDLGIGVGSEDISTRTGTIPDAGAASVMYGGARVGLQATAPDDQFWTQDSPSVLDVAEEGDCLGCGWGLITF